jgi:hypothetical protein
MVTTIPSSIAYFNVAQTFFVDPGVVNNAHQASITAVNLYFSKKPTATNNKSGLTNPGVTVFLCAVKTSGTSSVPDTSALIYGGTARVEYANIPVSADATAPTVFTFPFPVNIDTGFSYGILVKFDDVDYTLWKSVQGDKLVGSTTTTAGPAGKYIGDYFEFSYTATVTSSNNSLSTATNVSGTWNPLNTTDLKFGIYAANYIPNSYSNTTITDPITGNTSVLSIAQSSQFIQNDQYEYITFDHLNSNNVANLQAGELVYQNNVIRPETVSVIAGSNVITTTTGNFTTIFDNNNKKDKHLVIFNGTSKNIRRISNVVSNTVLTVDIPINFSNAAAQISKVVAGRLDITSITKAFGTTEHVIALSNSSANSSLRFTNNTIEQLSIIGGGTAYSNSDYIILHHGGVANGQVEANAIANVTTNSIGGITSILFTNKGVGFFIPPQISVMAANGAASNGSGFNSTVKIGASLMTEHSNAILTGMRVFNLPINSMLPGALDIEHPTGTDYYFKRHHLYYSTSDSVKKLNIISPGSLYSNSDTITFSGGGGSNAFATIVTDSSGKIVTANVVAHGYGFNSVPSVVISTSTGSGANLQPIVGVSRHIINNGYYSANIHLFDRAQTLQNTANTPLILSHSCEVMQPNVTLTGATGLTINTTSSSVVEMVVSSNNNYVASDILSSQLDVFFEKYIVNNDYSNEHLGTGNAFARHVTYIQTFANNYTAEDMLVYMDVYRPANTDIKVFAKIWNNKDPSYFVSKDWTLMRNTENQNAFSSSTNTSDLIEFTWAFNPYPNSAFTAVGTATSTSNSNVLTGSNSSYNTQFVAGDIVKLYSPLFPTNYMISSVNAVTNSSSIILDNLVSNNNVIGGGFLIDKIAFKNQAFNNGLNNNVVRYYDGNNAVYDGYNSFAIKIIFLSANEFTVPKVDNMRIVGVTA